MHFDDSAEAQLVADELRSEYEFMKKQVEGLEQKVATLDNENRELGRTVAKLVDMLQRQNQNEHAEKGLAQSDLYNLKNELSNRGIYP